MKTVKSLLLGSAAGLAALTGAQAADLPVKAKPVEYVKICSLYGAGFYYIPGTDTCIRIGGHIRAEVSFNSRGTGIQQWNVDGTGNATRTRDRDVFFTRSRVFTNVDTRTQTVVRHAAHVLGGARRAQHADRSGGIGGRHRHRRGHHPVGWLHDRPRRHVVLRQSVAIRLQVESERRVSAGLTRQAVVSLRPTRTSSATASPARCRWKTTRSASAASITAPTL